MGKTTARVALGLVLVVASLAPQPVHAAEARLIVGVVPGLMGEVARALVAAGARVDLAHEPGSFLVVSAPGGVPAGLGGVRFVEPDRVVDVDSAGPNDPLWSEQWAPEKISVPSAWTTTGGSADVVVGIVDSGIDLDHPDLATRLWRNPDEVLDGTDNDENGFIDDVHGADCRDGDGTPDDLNDHGTHVAGIIGAAVDNSEGIGGVDRGARLMALRFLGPDGRGRISDAIRCLDYALAEGARITNHSWGTSVRSQALEEAVARARAAGVLLVASAGNDGADLDDGTAHYPSGVASDNVVAVAATTSYDALAASSNRGIATVDIAAPGVGILSAIRGGYAKRSGTSMAAPHVTATAALVWAAHPSLGYRAVIERLLGSVDRTPGLEGAVASGGRLNAARAVERDAGAPARPVLHSLTALRTPTSVAIAWLAPDEDDQPGAGAVARYELRTRPRGSAAWSVHASARPAPPGVPERQTITGLVPATAYEVVLLAIDNAGNGTASAPIIASTG